MNKPQRNVSTFSDRYRGWSRYIVEGIGLTGLRVTAVGLGFVVTLLLSRGLGPSGFGSYAFALSLATLLALPLTGGLPTLLTREIAASREREQIALLAGVIVWSKRVFVLVTLGFWSLLVGVWGLGLQLDLWRWDVEGDTVMLIALLTPSLGALYISRSILAGHKLVFLGALGEQLFRPVLMVVLLLLLGGLIFPLGSKGALGIQLVATIAAVLLTVSVIRNSLPKYDQREVEFNSRAWGLALLPLTAISAITIIKNNTDILMLGVMVEPAEVGVYRIAAQVAILATVIMQIARALSAPRIAAAYAKKDYGTMQIHFVKTGRAMFVASLLFVVLFAIWGRAGLSILFGTEYVGAWAPCLALALGALFSSACGLVGMALQVTNHADVAARCAVAAALVNFVMNLALIPLWGALGAAVATSISLVVMQALQWWIARRVIGVRTDAFQRTRL